MKIVLEIQLAVCCCLFLPYCQEAAQGQNSRPTTAFPLNRFCPEISTRLSLRISATWSGQELSIVLKRIEATSGVPIWLDRRVDPQQMIEARVENLSIEQVLQKLCEDQTWGISCAGGLIYVGPRERVPLLPGLLEQTRQKINQLPDAQQAYLLQDQRVRWDYLTEPRVYVTDLLEGGGFKITNSQLIPHDLMPAAQYPSLRLGDFLSILLLGFDLDFEFARDGKTCKLVPLPQQIFYSKKYTLNANNRRLWRAARAEFRDHLESETARQVELFGTPEDHLRLQMLLLNPADKASSQEVDKRSSSRNLFTLRLEQQPLQTTLEQLARQLQMELEWNPELLKNEPQLLQQRVSCDVHQVDLQELMQAMLEPLGLNALIEGNRIAISPGPAKKK